ncbi:MAG: O-antigen ligase family protein [Verrucomicrobia bacterium]|nr:O-antigen ligase family protein [Verrucomicrobiota bacterium]
MLTRPVAAQLAALLVVLLPVWGAGSPSQIYISALFILAGLILLLFRPVIPLPRSITYAAIALVLGALLAFLPADWFARPEWRTTFQTYGKIALGSMVTPQPWLTVQGVGMLLAGVCFGLFLLCQPVNGEIHERLAGGFTLGVGVYAGCSIYAACTGWSHPWDSYHTAFGFLPNRNHVGTLLSMGAVAGLGTFWNALERRRWVQAAMLGAAITLIAIGALNFCESRAAAVLLFAGFFIWLAGVFRQAIDRRIALSASVLMLFALGVFLTSQTPSMNRLKETGAALVLPEDSIPPAANLEKPVSLGFRLLLYKDTCRMIADHPFTGIGLGNFRYLSQQYREASLSQAVAIHPDSSWLSIAAEAGLPTVGAALALVVLGFSRLRNCRRYPSWSVRWASATAVILFVGHCTFDVPAHRAATLLPALFLAGLAFRPSKGRPPQPCLSLRTSRAFFVVSGAAFLIAGAWLGGCFPKGLEELPSEAIENAPQKMYGMYKYRTEEGVSLAEKILAHAPLASELYYQWGLFQLNFEGTDKEVERHFAAERMLEPHLIETPLRQADAWLRINPTLSLSLFAEAMERADKQDLRSQEHNAQRTFQIIMEKVGSLPEIGNELYPLTAGRPDLFLIWGRGASDGTFQLFLHTVLASDPLLDRWSQQQQRELLRLWWQKGDRTEMQQLLREHPNLAEIAWPILSRHMAHELQYEQAWRTAEARLQLDTPDFFQEAGNSGRLRTAYTEHKTAIAAERLAKSLVRETDLEGVLRLVQEAKADSIQSPNLSRLASVAAARLSRWPEAWAYLVEMARAKNPELGL